MAHLTDLSRVKEPLGTANGLPNAHYIDPAVFAEERDALLFGQWAGLAVAADVPEAGDAKPITFMGMPLLLLRDRNDQVRVFQNTCRHRGMILVEEPRKIEGAIRCPYHSWCYSTEGKLVSTPMLVDQVRTRIQMWIVRHWALRKFAATFGAMLCG